MVGTGGPARTWPDAWAPSLRTSAGLGATRDERCRDRVVDLHEQADRTGPKPLKLRERLVLRGPYDMGKQSRSSAGGGRGRHFFIYEQSSSPSAAPPSGRFDTAPTLSRADNALTPSSSSASGAGPVGAASTCGGAGESATRGVGSVYARGRRMHRIRFRRRQPHGQSG